ncbi:hypothetical protein PR202_ga22349 [Eleusine coracana subsp. coracana]|uniref:Uncharacterized protein n=1 Tax=Eleusine coracana subsp. coracana TaxID=191504 RepID=A0AAV5D3N7_ELECO|nr:hypothetical protein PR202_ga22349 [Eleusine coracana subsp. coracana]
MWINYFVSRYLFVHGCFGRLRMSLFGYWVDDVAATKAVPFCCALVHFARVSTDERLRLFVSDELLPSVIKRLHDQLPCSIRHLIIPNDTVNKDLTSLCHESYNYLSSKSSAQGQDLMLECKGRGSAADDFTNWLAKLKEDLCVKAFSAAPEEFKEEEVKWNWEFQDEFERYLPVYIDILKEVDAMDDTLEGSDCPYSVIDQLQQSPETSFSTFAFDDVESSIHFLFDSVLYFWEPRFHPLIREGHKNLLLWIVDQLTNATEFEGFQPLTPSPEDFPLHLEPYALSYILTNLKTSEYAKAVGQARMHDAYDNHLSSGVLDDDIYKYMLIEDCYLGKDVDGWAVPCQFSDMDHDLIKLSLKRKDQVARLMNDLEVQGFFDIDDSHINWENKHFTELVDEFRNEVFADHCLPRHYVIQGIIVSYFHVQMCCV